MKKIKIFVWIIIIVSIMLAEYRFIMTNINPYIIDNNTVHIEFFGQVDEYEVG
jgi:hypothetical protein